MPRSLRNPPPSFGLGHADWCLCVAADEGFAFPLLLTLFTASRSNRYGMHVVVLGDGLSESTRHAAREIGTAAGWTIDIMDVAARTAALERSGTAGQAGLTRAALARLFIPEMVPGSYRRAVYVDVDVMVCGDLRPLAGFELDGRPIGAVAEAAVLADHFTKFADHGYNLDGRYFNSGVLLLDLERWRADDESIRLDEVIEDVNAWTHFGDQDYLNAHFAQRWAELPAKWNLQSRHFYPRRSRFALRRGHPIDLYSAWRDRRVVHFNSPRRPWARGADHPGRPAYLLAWARSPMRSVPGPAGITLRQAVVDRATIRSCTDACVALLRRS